MAGAGENDMVFLALNMSGWDDESLGIGYIGVSAFQTFSRGTLTIPSTDPFADPIVEIRMLSDERDLVRMRDGVQRLFAIGRHPAVTGISDEVLLRGRGFALTSQPSTLTLDELTDDAGIDDWMRTTVSDTQHPVGTCRMGAPDDPNAVVDPDCRVIGLRQPAGHRRLDHAGSATRQHPPDLRHDRREDGGSAAGLVTSLPSSSWLGVLDPAGHVFRVEDVVDQHECPHDVTDRTRIARTNGMPACFTPCRCSPAKCASSVTSTRCVSVQKVSSSASGRQRVPAACAVHTTMPRRRNSDATSLEICSSSWNWMLT